ncbi:cysteinyl-tRNA synthetase [Heterostelium album PN500]|uniref:cysteine--tRNA ligase n=1 Tax=Heterostelium pallidum (strain ATCC 26659 / Pp 5 / PN500) TaxID=670386 RepID=D3BDT0_HETP5|nr:cysteinyl-tRNA synthetase [Heterostelium album PN500]EFA80061.1 cysteinyl-tRNA synthetase [Heterostelium album PN500]|eukprot:XP_020432181.1 cysteinyl-tRNA synthetase [Heterostelium album PN500]
MLRGLLGSLRKQMAGGSASRVTTNNSSSSVTGVATGSHSIQNSVDHTRWRVPSGHPTGISMRNSLSHEKKPVPLVLENSGRTISWYTCGPTVYDSAHLGHARAYVSIDIVQRVLTDYFNLNINHVMGMTDVDDKIIKMSATKGMSFKELARQKELEFIQDMDSLNVRPPLLITRVSEHIPNIINFVKQIRENGYAYDVDIPGSTGQSVLFDTGKFGTRYGKLEKENQGAQADENLAIQSDVKLGTRDFALWKSANPITDVDGQGKLVVWNSPFGDGRPGWHIECSSMIHSIFGDKLDVHAGGIDLKFPHHENEIAQCEAHFSPHPNPATGEYKQWVNYFMHIGHLNIKGLKMSKSLKNFITIREYLAKNTATSFRWLCLTNRYFDTINYNPKSDEQYQNSLQRFIDWFNMVEMRMMEPININLTRASYQQAKPIIDLFNLSKNDIHLALTDDFNTPKAIKIMQLLVKETMMNNTQLKSIPRDILFNIYCYLRKMFTTFGFEELFSKSKLSNNSMAMLQQMQQLNEQQQQQLQQQSDKLQQQSEQQQQVLLDSNSEKDLKLLAQSKLLEEKDKENLKLLERFLDFRAELRSIAKNNSNDDVKKQLILQMCDSERDSMLYELGIRVGDESNDEYTYEMLTEKERVKLQEKNAQRFVLDHQNSDVALEYGENLEETTVDQTATTTAPPTATTTPSTTTTTTPSTTTTTPKTTSTSSSSQKKPIKKKSSPSRQLIEEDKTQDNITENQDVDADLKYDPLAESPEVIFINRKDLYSKFDEDGIPTHDASGTQITMSQRKLLKKIMRKRVNRVIKKEAKIRSKLDNESTFTPNSLRDKGDSKN